MSELDYAKEQSAMDDDWCDDCHGYTHAPWCPNYRAPDEISDEEYRQLDQEQNWQASQTEPLVKIVSERSKLRVENERLREALRQFARHPETCSFCVYEVGVVKTEQDCDCGLYAALTGGRDKWQVRAPRLSD